MRMAEFGAVTVAAVTSVVAWGMVAAMWSASPGEPPPAAHPVTAPPQHAALPQIITSTPLASPHRNAERLPLPQVVRPSAPERAAMVSGTGFFVTTTGHVLTARHVVADCRHTEILSPHVKPVKAELVAVAPADDLALLRAPTRPPGLVGVATHPPGGRDLAVFGYPSGGDLLIPTETAARARPAMEPGPLVWLNAAAVRPGFSGGPVVNADGAAVGLIQGVMYRSADGKPQDLGIAVGPDARAIDGFLRRSIANFETAQPWAALAGDTAAARKAVVRVLCRR
jgi:S1-C subfamily serine protease